MKYTDLLSEIISQIEDCTMNDSDFELNTDTFIEGLRDDIAEFRRDQFLSRNGPQE